MTQFSISTKSVCLIGLLAIAFVAVQGCSSEPPKSGVAIKTGDYEHAPGGGNPNKPPGKS